MLFRQDRKVPFEIFALFIHDGQGMFSRGGIQGDLMDIAGFSQIFFIQVPENRALWISMGRLEHSSARLPSSSSGT